ncbi:AMP-binding protein [Streptomyces sp. S1D4-11]
MGRSRPGRPVRRRRRDPRPDRLHRPAGRLPPSERRPVPHRRRGRSRPGPLAHQHPQPVLPDGCPAVALDLPDLTRAPRPAAPPQIPGHDQIVKVIHTSGTTSAPKGVQIRRHGLDELLTSLRARTRPEIFERYLSIVPLSLLIEQVA